HASGQTSSISFAKFIITGIVRKFLNNPPIPNVSAIVCRRPYFLGISKSMTVLGSYPPTCIALITYFASRNASLRSVSVTIRTDDFKFFLLLLFIFFYFFYLF